MLDTELLEDVQKIYSLIQTFIDEKKMNCSELDFLRKFIQDFGGKIQEEGDSEKSLDLAPQVLEVLRQFIESIEMNKSSLKMQEFQSIKELIESYGGDISSVPDVPKMESDEFIEKEFPEPNPEDESDAERIEPDTLQDSQNMGSPSNIVTEEMIDLGNEHRVKGQAALSEQKYELAIEEFTNAIKQCRSAAFFAHRAGAYLAIKRPNAAIKDCETAIYINPDNSKAYKVKGKAHRSLGQWREAAESLRTANKLDFDEDTYNLQKTVEAKIATIEDYRKRKVEFYKNQTSNLKVPQEFSDMLNSSEEIQQLLQDPELNAMINEIGTNLDAFAKYQFHPKILNYFQAVSRAVGTKSDQ